MSKTTANPPMPMALAPDLQADELDEVLAEPLSVSVSAPAAGVHGALRQRLLARVARSLSAEAGMVTVRQRGLARQPVAPGVHAQTLYQAQPGQALRPGEPLRCQLLYLAAGTTLDSRCLGPARAAPVAAPGQAATVVREWLVMAGELDLHLASAPTGQPPSDTPAPPQPTSQQHLSLRDYHRSPLGAADLPAPVWHTAAGAQLFLRESTMPRGAPTDAPSTVKDADAGWPDFAPGIQRRVLWQGQGHASMLYLAAPGALVPHHAHGHDEECLMVQGELFLDDVLLQGGDYQLAPAGTGHTVTHTDTGVVIFAHGDQDLQFI